MQNRSTALDCPFCCLPLKRILLGTDRWRLVRDAFPVSPGHTLVIPVRHVLSIFDLTPDEFNELRSVMKEAKRDLDAEFNPAGYNIGVNDGVAAGQTVQHLHLHLIPRFAGDCLDPRGGVRWILPNLAKYWVD